jgi:hypothetical protein
LAVRYGIMRRAAPSVATVRMLLQDVAAGIRVLRARDGLDISDDQIIERARNIVTGLVGNYHISSMDPPRARPRLRPSRPIAQLQLDLLAAIEKTAVQISKDHASDA